jgi:hypothetical protein
VPRPTEKSTIDSDWEAFEEWFVREENQLLLHTLAAENHLAIYGHAKSGTVKLTPSEDQWLLHDDKGTHPVNKASSFLETLQPKGAVQLEIAHDMDKAAALSRKDEITNDIVDIFNKLMPLYANAVIHNRPL